MEIGVVLILDIFIWFGFCFKNFYKIYEISSRFFKKVRSKIYNLFRRYFYFIKE